MNIGGVDVSEQQQQKGDFCVCRASAPMALLRREWGGRAGGCPPPRWGGAFLRSLSRPNHATGWFDPATPLPDAEVSFLMGEVIHQAGMEQRSGFEPPLPAWKAGVLTVEH